MLGNREPTDVFTGVSSGKLACGDSLAEGGPVASVDVASRLCDKEGNTSAMLVLDDELVLFVAHDTADGNHPTLVLHCERRHVEAAALREAEQEAEQEESADEDESDGSPRGLWLWIGSFPLPTKVGTIGGGTGFFFERVAGYLSMLMVPSSN